MLEVKEFTHQWLELLAEAARSVAKQAYVPYSHFPVGAAVLTSQGGIFSGCNVENASYGLSICAERNAVFQSVARGHGPTRIIAVVVYTPTATATSPCGACRQVIHEFGAEAKVISICDTDHRLDLSMTELLPFAFGPDKLFSPEPAA